MIAGKLVLGRLSLEFGNAKERFAELSRELDRLTKVHERLIEDEQRVLNKLARIYLPELSPEAVSSGLTELSGTMRQALAAQEEHRRKLEARLAQLPEDVARRELVVAEAERYEEQAASTLESVRGAVETELAADEEYTAAVEEHAAIMERRSILTQRRTRLQTTASAERYRYEGDRAFSHLFERRYGDPTYRGGFFARRLDAWLARRIDYERLLANYRILREGPGVMHVELRDLTDRAGDLEREIDRRESEVADRHELHVALAADEAAQEGLLDARRALIDIRAQYDRLVAEIRAVDANRGRPYEEALDAHEDFLDSKSIAELVDIARSTPDPMDDGLVAQLEDIRNKLDATGAELAPLRERLAEANQRATSIGDLARKASERFGSRRSFFPESVNLPRLMASLLDGPSESTEALDRLEAAHVRRPLLEASRATPASALFADLSARYDRELGAVEVKERTDASETEVVVYDHQGRVLHRRVTRRSGS